jgi:hypothetical protein
MAQATAPLLDSTLTCVSIVFVAAEIVNVRRGRPSLTARWPWLVAFAFGLLHGFRLRRRAQRGGITCSHHSARTPVLQPRRRDRPVDFRRHCHGARLGGRKAYLSPVGGGRRAAKIRPNRRGVRVRDWRCRDLLAGRPNHRVLDVRRFCYMQLVRLSVAIALTGLVWNALGCGFEDPASATVQRGVLNLSYPNALYVICTAA